MTRTVSQTCLIIGIILFFLGSSILIFEPYDHIFKEVSIFWVGIPVPTLLSHPVLIDRNICHKTQC